MGAEQTPSAGLWPAIASGRRLSPDEIRTLRPAVLRLAMLTSPALADWLLSTPSDDGGAVIAPEMVQRSRLYNRFARAQGLRWLRAVVDAGIDVVCLKGFAAALSVYPDPDLRGMGDVDILVRERDVSTLVRALMGMGFAFKQSAGTPIWGLASTASFHPLVSSDGLFAFDLHIHPDADPIHRGLGTEAVFAQAVTADVGGIMIKIPSGPHFLLLAIANAARDKLGPDAVKSVTDAFAYLTRTPLDPGWEIIVAAARAGGFTRTLRAVLTVLARLGVPPGRLPIGYPLDLGSIARAELERAVADYAALFPAEPGKLALQRREILLLAPPAVIARRYGRRIRGLIRPWPGIPKL
jgi:hypothetical protein